MPALFSQQAGQQLTRNPIAGANSGV